MNSIRGRLLLIVLVTQAILVPPVILAIRYAVEKVMAESFVDDARSYAQIFALELSSVDIKGSSDYATRLLDTAILGGHCVYAVLESDGETVVSSLIRDEEVDQFNEDFEFGTNDDSVYYLSVPITRADYMAILRLGFDESAVHASLDWIGRIVLYVLLVFLVLSLVLTTIVGATIVEPLRRLQRASRSISSGEVSRELESTSRLVEIRDLSHDLETMRQKLVGMAERVREEMREREFAESERRSMEAVVRQTQRLESLGTLAGGVAHEFNNVLQPILLYTELALEDVPPQTMSAVNLQRVLELALRAKGLTRQILTFGRQEERAEFRLCDIREVVDEAVTMIRALLPATVDIRSRAGRDIGPINCDPSQIKQLLVNLCNNAFQALSSPDGHIEVSVDQVQVADGTKVRNGKLAPGGYVVLQVADSGRGMDERTTQRIFEPFFTTNEVGHGTGLGLSVVHGIVVQHGGEISVASEPGKGTRFLIYLPLGDETASDIDNRENNYGQDISN